MSNNNPIQAYANTIFELEIPDESFNITTLNILQDIILKPSHHQAMLYVKELANHNDDSEIDFRNFVKFFHDSSYTHLAIPATGIRPTQSELQTAFLDVIQKKVEELLPDESWPYQSLVQITIGRYNARKLNQLLLSQFSNYYDQTTSTSTSELKKNQLMRGFSLIFNVELQNQLPTETLWNSFKMLITNTKTIIPFFNQPIFEIYQKFIKKLSIAIEGNVVDIQLLINSSMHEIQKELPKRCRLFQSENTHNERHSNLTHENTININNLG